MIDRYEEPVETPHNGYERIGIRSHAKGVFHSYVEAGKELDTAKMHRVAADKFILNITFAWEHAVAITEEEDAGTLVSHRFPQFSFHEDLKSHFFKFLMLDRRFREYLELCSPGGAGRNRVLNINDMLKYKINVPSVEEQTKIGEYFDNLDNLITLHQCKYVYYTKYRTGLQSCNDWEQRKFGDVVDVQSGRDYKHLSEGDIPVYGTGGYMLSVSEALSYNQDAIGIGRKGTIDKPYVLKAPFWTVDTLFYALPREKYNLSFLNCIFQNVDWKKKDESTGVPSLSKTTINDVDVIVPNETEQKAIGLYFDNLDHLITLHQRKLISEEMEDFTYAKRNKMYRFIL